MIMEILIINDFFSDFESHEPSFHPRHISIEKCSNSPAEISRQNGSPARDPYLAQPVGRGETG